MNPCKHTYREILASGIVDIPKVLKGIPGVEWCVDCGATRLINLRPREVVKFGKWKSPRWALHKRSKKTLFKPRVLPHHIPGEWVCKYCGGNLNTGHLGTCIQKRS